MTIFQSAAAAVCSCLDSLATGAAAATAGRFYKEKHLAACYSCLNWGKKIALYWLRRCLNYVLSAATAAASAIIYTSQKETFGWGLTFTLRDILILLYLNFLFQICDRISIASTASDVSQISSTNPPLWHFPNSTEPSEAYYCHPVLRHGQEESCPRTFLGWKSVRQKADFYLLPCWILGGLR